MAFSSSDLMEGRVYLIPSVNCSKETVDNQLSILQQITNTRGLNHQQSLTVRINISPRRHIISVCLNHTITSKILSLFIMYINLPRHMI